LSNDVLTSPPPPHGQYLPSNVAINILAPNLDSKQGPAD